MKKKKEEWNPKNMLTKEKINKTIENFAHFTFKVSNSNALSGGFVQSNNSRMLEVNIFKRIADYAKELVGMEIPTKQQAMIPYANPNMSPPTNQSGVLKGEARVHITVDQNGKLTQQTQSIPLKWDFGSLGSK